MYDARYTGEGKAVWKKVAENRPKGLIKIPFSSMSFDPEPNLYPTAL